MHDVRMPDFEDRLELELRSEMRRTTRARRVRAGGATVAVVATVATATLAALDENSPLGPAGAQAQPLPAILYRDPASPAPSVADLGIADAQRSRARDFPIASHRGYVVPNQAGDWCISIPDLAAGDPATERATACVSGQKRLRDFGLSVRSGRVVAAAVPPAARPPIRQLGDERSEVPVDGNGVAVVDDLRPNERVTIYGDAESQTYINRQDVKKRGICSDGRVVDRPGDC